MKRSLRPRRWDVISAAAIVLLTVPELAPRHGGPGAVAFDIAFAIPLLWRSRWPFPVFLVTAGIAFVQWLVGVRVLGDFALLIALYTVASREDRRTSLTAAAILEFGVILALARWFHDGHIRSFVGLTGLVAAAGILGQNIRNRRQLLESLRERADRLEYERDQQGKLAAAAERARIARELHDVVAHNLTVMIALADGAGYSSTTRPTRRPTALETASRTGREALAEMRRLLGVLREQDEAAGWSPSPASRDRRAGGTSPGRRPADQLPRIPRRLRPSSGDPAHGLSDRPGGADEHPQAWRTYGHRRGRARSHQERRPALDHRQRHGDDGSEWQRRLGTEGNAGARGRVRRRCRGGSSAAGRLDRLAHLPLEAEELS